MLLFVVINVEMPTIDINIYEQENFHAQLS